MKKVIVSLLAALALLVGYHTTPASAHQLPGLTWTVDHHEGCYVTDQYGNYGNGFAKMIINTAECNDWYTGVGVSTAYNGVIYEAWCNIAVATYQPSSQCQWINYEPATIQVAYPGTAFAMKAQPCIDYGSGVQCAIAEHAFV